jgi:hypothetical protein
MARHESARPQALAPPAALAAILIAACQTAPPPVEPGAVPDVPEVGTMPPDNAERFEIVRERSELRVLVYRDGPMANLGHNHVIRSASLSGSVWMASPLADSFVSIILPVTTVQIDDPAARAEAGEDFPGTLDASAVSGTRDNLLGEKLLNAAEYPFIRLSCGNLSDAPARTIDCRVAIAGGTSQLRFPLTLTQMENRLVATGERDVSHAELGLTPYSVGLGALRVAETMRVRYTIEAQRLSEN